MQLDKKVINASDEINSLKQEVRKLRRALRAARARALNWRESAEMFSRMYRGIREEAGELFDYNRILQWRVNTANTDEKLRAEVGRLEQVVRVQHAEMQVAQARERSAREELIQHEMGTPRPSPVVGPKDQLYPPAQFSGYAQNIQDLAQRQHQSLHSQVQQLRALDARGQSQLQQDAAQNPYQQGISEMLGAQNHILGAQNQSYDWCECVPARHNSLLRR